MLDPTAPDSSGQSPSDTAIVAFFDVDNTLLRGASAFHIAKAARRQRLLTIRDILRFCWHQASFLLRGENNRHLGTIQERALQIADGYREDALRSLAVEVFERDIVPRLWPETVELTQEHLAKGHQVWLISATPQIVGNVIAERLGLTGALGTVFESHDGILTGKFDGAVLHGEQKAVAAKKLTGELHANLADCWAYSDSRNDIPLLTLVGHRVVVNPDARLTKHARALGWPILELKRSSIKAAQKLVRKEARAVRGATPKPPKAAKKRLG